MKNVAMLVIFVFGMMLIAFVANAEEVKAGVVAGHSVVLKEHQGALDQANCDIAKLKERIETLEKQKTSAAKSGKDTVKVDAKIKALEKLLADKAKEIAKLEAKAAGVEAGKEVLLRGYEHEENILDKYLGSAVEPEQYKHLMPKEAPIMGVVRKDCPDGTVQRYKKTGGHEEYTCDILRPEISWGEAFGYCAVGSAALGAGAGASNFYIGQSMDRHVEGVRDGLAVGLITAVVALPVCAGLVKLYGR
jgi:hypothetical protein